ncbi:hypothetical protein [Novosphingobium gossypii]|uniref:hypothetical protein n=1 Tax=Novosphingobium gossypii TaxID=1604774 RepID=UPI003D240799
MADKIEVTVLRQKVFHDGTSMVVLKPGDQEIDSSRVAGLVDEGIVEDPEERFLRLNTEGEEEDDSELADLRERILVLEAENADLATLRARVTELETERDELITELNAADEKLSKLDPDGDGNPGGSLPQDPPVLTGKNKAELLAIAKDEGVPIADGATNAQIVESIEAARAGGSEDDAPPA